MFTSQSLASSSTTLAKDHARLGNVAPQASKVGYIGLQLMLWATVGVFLVIDLLWSAFVDLSIEGWWNSAGVAIVLLFVATLYRHRSRKLEDTANLAALWISLTATGCVLSYLAATCARPLQDSVLANLDRAIGFDWLEWHDVVAARPGLHLALTLAYSSLLPQIAASIIVLPVLNVAKRGYELVQLIALTLVPTILISALWPVLGPFDKFNKDSAEFLPHLLALRTAGPWHFNLTTMQGIIQMPSYHMIMAVLFTYAYRGTGPIFLMVAMLNGFMLLSIPFIGGHYLVDMLAGAAIAVLSITSLRGMAEFSRHPRLR